MQRILIATALVAAFAGNAFAESPNAGGSDSFTSTKSRAEVAAELAQFKSAGVNPWSASYDPLKGFQSTTARAAVTAEYMADRDQVAATHGEDGGAAWMHAATAKRTHLQTIASK